MRSIENEMLLQNFYYENLETCGTQNTEQPSMHCSDKY